MSQENTINELDLAIENVSQGEVNWIWYKASLPKNFADVVGVAKNEVYEYAKTVKEINKAVGVLGRVMILGGVGMCSCLYMSMFTGQSINQVFQIEVVESVSGENSDRNFLIDGASGVALEMDDQDCQITRTQEDSEDQIQGESLKFEGVYEGSWQFENYSINVDPRTSAVEIGSVEGSSLPDSLSGLESYDVYLSRNSDLGIFSLDFSGRTPDESGRIERGFVWVDELTGEIVLDTRGDTEGFSVVYISYIDYVDKRYAVFSRGVFGQSPHSELVLADLENGTQTVVGPELAEGTSLRLSEWRRINDASVFIYSYREANKGWNVNFVDPSTYRVNSIFVSDDIQDFDIDDSGRMVFLHSDYASRNWLQLMSVDENLKVTKGATIEIGAGSFVDVYLCDGIVVE